jgi:hypothetical protein
VGSLPFLLGLSILLLGDLSGPPTRATTPTLAHAR